MPEPSLTEISTEQHRPPFIDIGVALKYFFEQVELHLPAEAYLIKIGDEENYRVILNQKPTLNEGPKKITVIANAKISIKIPLPQKSKALAMHNQGSEDAR